MGLKHTIAVLGALLCLGTPWAGAQAEPQDDDTRARGTREREPQIIIRTDADKRQRSENKAASDNSNRQSSPDATRGLERAEERRPEQAGSDNNNEDGWFGSVFDWSDDDKKEKDKDTKEDESNWWWPFD